MMTLSTAEQQRSLHQTEALLGIARRLLWWLPPEEGLAQRALFIAQVMTLGTWDDVEIVRDALGEPALRSTLKEPPPGVFDLPSWHYWHRRFGLEPAPSLPKRRLP
ncbi:MAG: hypothetical protein FJ398_08280 [Verrucomicrobia bacterium]|nr:hypothetical protein [Verrucomicrobiota bacterium]